MPIDVGVSSSFLAIYNTINAYEKCFSIVFSVYIALLKLVVSLCWLNGSVKNVYN